MYKKYIIGGVLIILLVVLVITLLMPSSKECEGVKDSKSSCYYLINKYDLDSNGYAQYRIDNAYPDSVLIDKFSIYVENSGSMDAYVKSYTNLKTVVDLLQSNASNISKQVECFYVNNTVRKFEGSNSKFAREGLDRSMMAPPAGCNNDVKKKYGNRNDTELSDVIDSVITRTNHNEVSVLISDFVSSPNGGSEKDINNYITAFSNRIKGCLKRKIASSPKIGIMLCRYKSEFDGKYYFANNDDTLFVGKRPFYALFVGDYGLLAKIQREAKIFEGMEDYCIYYVSQSDIPYGVFSGQLKTFDFDTHKSIHKHLKMSNEIRSKVEKDSDAVFLKMKIDLSCLPCKSDYLLSLENYSMESESFYLTNIEEAKGPDSDKFTHVISLRNRKATFPNNNKVRILLNSESYNWEVYNTMKGHQYLSREDSMKTLGIEPLRQSIEDAFSTMSKRPSCYAVFEFLIN